MLSIVILAAGNSRRMQSSTPKVLHPLGGIPLLLHVLKAAQLLNPETIYIVHGHGAGLLKKCLEGFPVQLVEQNEARGTGHALLQVMPLLDDAHRLLVLYGDVPLIQPRTLQKLLAATSHDELGVLVAHLDNPSGFGRIIRDCDHNITGIVEHKDATEEELKISEINTGIITTPVSKLKQWLPRLTNHNTQSEYYLTDIFPLAVQDKVKIVEQLANCSKEIQGVNTRQELISLERYYQQQLANKFLSEGVTILDPQRFDCRGSIQLAKDVVVDINVILEGDVVVGEGTMIGPHTVLRNVHIGNNTIIKANSMIEDAIIGDNCIIGPFARIRPNTRLSDGVHVGNFVELKNTQVASHSKVNHHTYLGDTIVGSHVNVGAGTITCNYDGKSKHQTVIKDGAFIGSGTELVAPLVIGDKAYIGAGSTLTKDAPEGQLTLSRAKQVSIKDWKRKR